MKRAVHKNSLKNLTNREGRPTPDKLDKTKRSTINFDEGDFDWLKTLPDGISFNVREAVRMYKKLYDRRKELV